ESQNRSMGPPSALRSVRRRLDRKTRLCTIYARRPDTCRNHPRIGPRPGYCAYRPR
ncbi:YkgJ family cysteine cluster protein, partial [Pseudomonas aeruginosa]|uniref:YkgJ family cysteine cluster protein n=1 Tax=Pseudomonas aeruginosa TaxID=287 RepID=UPI003968E47E